MTIRDGKYPNKDDFKPYIDKNAPEGTVDLPLSDPAESHTTKRVYSHHELVKGRERPSAFSVNKARNHQYQN